MIAGITFSWPFYSYGIIMLFAFLVGLFLFHKSCKLNNVDCPGYVDVSLTGLSGALIGSRLAYILLFPEQFKSSYEFFALHEGGLVFFGGLILGSFFLLLLCIARSCRVSVFYDNLCPSLSLMHAIGRIGCLINGCCYGIRTEWLQIYHLQNDAAGTFRHPTQLYESIFLFSLTGVLLVFNWQVYKNRKKFPGFASGFYLIAYSLFRFLLEFLRGDERGSIAKISVLSPSQLVAAVLVFSGFAWLIYWRRHFPVSNNNE